MPLVWLHIGQLRYGERSSPRGLSQISLAVFQIGNFFFWGERYMTLTFLRVLCMKFPSEFVMEKEHPASGVEWLERISPEES